jgi:hypothetical protein
MSRSGTEHTARDLSGRTYPGSTHSHSARLNWSFWSWCRYEGTWCSYPCTLGYPCSSRFRMLHMLCCTRRRPRHGRIPGRICIGTAPLLPGWTSSRPGTADMPRFRCLSCTNPGRMPAVWLIGSVCIRYVWRCAGHGCVQMRWFGVIDMCVCVYVCLCVCVFMCVCVCVCLCVCVFMCVMTTRWA